jgi:citrate lyase alpha subunit
MSYEAIQEGIKNRTDLYELSRILHRIIVNYGVNDYDWKSINEYLKKNKSYKEFHDQQKKSITEELSHMPQKIQDRMLLRSLIYHAIEHNIIDKMEIITKHSLRMPSDKVVSVLDRLTDLDVKNVFELFDMFKRSD